jgi:hypothetical protein
MGSGWPRWWQPESSPGRRRPRRRGDWMRWDMPWPPAYQTMSLGVVTSSSGQMGRWTFWYGIFA